MWFLGRVRSTGQLVEIPEVSAMTRFDALSDDFSVWTTHYVDGEARPLVVARRDLERLPELSEVAL